MFNSFEKALKQCLVHSVLSLWGDPPIRKNHLCTKPYSKDLFKGVEHALLKIVFKRHTFLYTPGSMNRLFSDFFKTSEGVILGVFGTIGGCLVEIFGGQLA